MQGRLRCCRRRFISYRLPERARVADADGTRKTDVGDVAMRARRGHQRCDAADLLKHFARALPKGSNRPVLQSAQLLSQIAALFKPTLANGKDFFPIVEQGDWQWRVEERGR
jgi:hypothetical protein